MVPVERNNTNGDEETNVNNNNVNGGMNLGDGDLDNGNTSENPENGLGNDQGRRRSSKRKRYHRHSQHQIQEMESFFKECPHPDDKQRKELSRQLGLEHLQIKFWFQNKRTQNKNQLERHENNQLRSENDRLRADNQRYREAILNSSCPSCGKQTALCEMSFEEHHLRLENAKLSEDIHHLAGLAANVTGNQVTSYPALSPPPVPTQAVDFGMGREVFANMDNLSIRSFAVVNNADKPVIIELALVAMDELLKVSQIGDPLWKVGADGTSLALDFNEYNRAFCNGLGPVPDGFRLEASKETAVVFMNPTDIVGRLMNVNQWSTTFAGIVGKAMTHEALLFGVNGSYDGTFQLMTAEYKVLSPLVSTRESYFIRHSKHQGDGLWAVVDVSIDHFVQNVEFNCRRRPSGCLIQDLGNGFASRVTWLEHVEVDDRGKVNSMFKQYMSSGQALGAKRWLATLDRVAQRLALATASITPMERIELTQISIQGKKSLVKLSDRMMKYFFSGVTASNEDVWCTLTNYTTESVKVMTRKSLSDPGLPPGVILCAATSFWVPVPHQVIFDFLIDEKNRAHWDVLTHGAVSHKVSQIVTGKDSKNCIALYRSLAHQRKMMMVQENATDATASYVIYAPVDISEMDRVFSGSDSSFTPILPSGFVVLPDGMAQPGNEGGGSLVNVSFQILAESSPASLLTVSSVATIENLILSTVQRIQAYFHFHNA
ncbi:unnamed protein product [Microthlaspi erraticum]|uniref:Homeobox domain-containing protein n=1 Tax=Microthlaspi erraticum TaxID=1685480 RepID=A0A6D2K916_9BRAS|nr:unnamed protein product [Microthlaspi erraticum]